MFVAWGVLVPAAIISARYLKGVKEGLWFKLHQAFNALALIAMIVALVVVVCTPTRTPL